MYRVSKMCNNAITRVCKIFVNLRKMLTNKRKKRELTPLVCLVLHVFYFIFNACFCAKFSLRAFDHAKEFAFKKSGYE